MAKVKAETLFCDDIRQELNGKHILIGVYGADLVPFQLPSTFPISVWVRLWEIPVGQHAVTFRLHAPNQASTAEMKGQIDVSDASAPIVLVFGGLPMQVTSPGEAVAELVLNDGEPIRVGALKISEPPQKLTPAT